MVCTTRGKAFHAFEGWRVRGFRARFHFSSARMERTTERRKKCGMRTRQSYRRMPVSTDNGRWTEHKGKENRLLSSGSKGQLNLSSWIASPVSPMIFIFHRQPENVTRVSRLSRPVLFDQLPFHHRSPAPIEAKFLSVQVDRLSWPHDQSFRGGQDESS